MTYLDKWIVVRIKQIEQTVLFTRAIGNWNAAIIIKLILWEKHFIHVKNIGLLLANVFFFATYISGSDPISVIHSLTCDKPTSCDYLYWRERQ